MRELPKIISVDDHVIEPATVWTDRLPSKYHDVGPRIVRAPVKEMTFIGGKFTAIPGDPGDRRRAGRLVVLRGPAPPAHPARHRGRLRPRRDHAQGHHLRRHAPGLVPACPSASPTWTSTTSRRRCASRRSPASAARRSPRRATRSSRLLCVQAYNDWMVEEWCGASGGRLIPLIIVPLWDAELAAAEVRRNADRGVHAVCFSEIPPNLGLPSIHDTDGYWLPFFEACNETGRHDQHAHRVAARRCRRRRPTRRRRSARR